MDVGRDGRMWRWGRRGHVAGAVLGVAMLVGGAAAVAQAGASGVSASVARTDELADGDDLTVELTGIEGRDEVYLSQCVISDELVDGISCRRPAVAVPTPRGTASLLLTVRAEVGGDPNATCPPPAGGACVLRVTQGGMASKRAAGPGPIQRIAGTSAGNDDVPPPDGRRLVQDIGVTFLGPGDEPPTTSPSGTGPPDTVGGVAIPPGVLPTAPVDAPRGTSATAPPGAEVAGALIDGPDRTSIPVTGNGQTVALAIAGLVLLDLGWLSRSAARGARRATTTPSSSAA